MNNEAWHFISISLSQFRRSFPNAPSVRAIISTEGRHTLSMDRILKSF